MATTSMMDMTLRMNLHRSGAANNLHNTDNRVKQNETKRNKTKQNETKRNKTKQNKRKRDARKQELDWMCQNSEIEKGGKMRFYANLRWQTKMQHIFR